MSSPPITPIFVDRKTAAARLMISVYTFDAWVRAGFIPRAHIDRGQVVRWHWPSIEEKLVGSDQEAAETDPYMEKVAEVFSKKRNSRSSQ